MGEDAGVRDEPALFRRRPWLRGHVPHVALGAFPTPVERIAGLLPPSVELWVKREDRAGVAYGGNKVRKLEFLLAEARAAGRERVATIGAWGSHHALATAIYARTVGLGCELFLFPQPLTDHVRAQLRADVAAGAVVHAERSLAAIGPRVVGARLSGSTAYVAAGGSSPVGTLGWVSAADELLEQVERGELPAPDLVYAPLGSCGTVAGLLAGLRGARRVPEVVAVRVVERAVCGLGPTRALEEATAALLGASEHGPLVPLRVAHGQIGAGYGHATDAARAAVVLAAAHGLALEPTYTGKAMAQLLADAASGELDGKRVLFLATYSSVDLAPLLAAAPDAALSPSVRRVLELPR